MKLIHHVYSSVSSLWIPFALSSLTTPVVVNGKLGEGEARGPDGDEATHPTMVADDRRNRNLQGTFTPAADLDVFRNVSRVLAQNIDRGRKMANVNAMSSLSNFFPCPFL